MALLITPRLFQTIAWLPLRSVMRLFGRLEIRGSEHLAGLHSNVIFACNHTSEVDPVLLVACPPLGSRHIPLVFCARDKRYYASWGWRSALYGGTFFKLMGAYPIRSGLKDYAAALETHVGLARTGHSLCIFPAGFHTPGNPYPRARGGVGYLAHATAIPVVPVHIEGVYDLSPWSLWRGHHRVRVTFGKPIEPPKLEQITRVDSDNNPYAEFAHTVMGRVHEIR